VGGQQRSPQVYYAEQGDPGGEPVVLIHPHAYSWYSFSRVLSLLPARYHAYALDQRGHGDSERPAGDAGRRPGAQDPLPVAFVRELHTSVAHVPLPEPIFEQLVAQSLKAPAHVWRDGSRRALPAGGLPPTSSTSRS
jgi:pimeloyl-ACP methyl ester carboxylesterase